MDQSLTLEMSAEVSLELLEDLGEDLALDLNSSRDVKAEVVTRPLGQGERAAEVVSIGQLVLVLLSSHGVSALIHAIQRVMMRDRTVKVKLKNKTGQTIEIAGKNVTPETLEQTVQAVEKLLTKR